MQLRGDIMSAGDSGQSVQEFELSYFVKQDQTSSRIELRIEGSPTSDIFRNVHSTVAQLLATHKTPMLFLDIRNLVSIDARDRVWICTDWFPIARNAGLKYISGIMPTRSTARVIMVEPLATIAAAFEIQVNWFEEEISASQSIPTLTENS